MAFFEKGHACIIGVGDDLPCTVDDAEGLIRILIDPERCAYPEGQVKRLVEEEASKQGIIDALEHLATVTTKDSTVLIYFSGHGYRQTEPMKAYYLMPYGYNRENPTEIAISEGELFELLRKIPAQKLLLLLDCCHADGFMDASEFVIAKSPLPQEVITRFERGSGCTILSSSREDELSYGGRPYSAFTTALIEGLCGQGSSKHDGYVRTSDLGTYIHHKVATLTEDKQHPVYDHNAGSFILAYYAGGQSESKGVPPKLANGSVIDLESGNSELEDRSIRESESEDRSARAIVEVFIVYSDDDEDLRNEFFQHLAAIRRDPRIQIWDNNRTIGPGLVRDDEIQARMGSAGIMVPLLTPSFMDSDEYCLMEQEYNKKRVPIIPVMTKPCFFQETPFGGLVSLPRNGKPVTTWPDRNEAWLGIATEIRQVVNSLIEDN